MRERDLETNNREQPLEQLLEQLKQEARQDIEREFSPEKCKNNPSSNLTLFEHLLIGSSIKGQGILDKNTPIAILAGGDPETARKERERYIEENKGFPLGTHMLSEAGRKVFYSTTLELKDPRVATSIDNIDFENTAITDALSGKPLSDKDKKKEIIQEIFSQTEKRWQEKQDEKLKEKSG